MHCKGWGLQKLRPQTSKCLNRALGHHEAPELPPWALGLWKKVVRNVFTGLNVVSCMVETGDDYCQGDSHDFKVHKGSGTCHIFQSLGSKTPKEEKRDLHDSRYLPAKQPINVDHARTVHQITSDTSLRCEKKHCGGLISFHVWHTWSQPLVQNMVEGDSYNHQGFLLLTEALCLLQHNLQHKIGSLCITGAHNAFVSQYY